MRRERDMFDDLFGMTLRPGRMLGFPMNMDLPTPEDLGFKMAPPMPVDLIKTETGLKIKAVLSGVKKEDIDLRIKDDVLIIKAVTSNTVKEEKANYVHSEIRVGTSTRCIDVHEYKKDTIKSSYVDGVLEITIDKKEPPTDEEKNGIKINIE